MKRFIMRHLIKILARSWDFLFLRERGLIVLAISFLLLPSFAFAAISGMDDVRVNITPETQKQLDDTISTYYQHPSPQKVETVLDIMNNSDLLRKKTAWAPMVGFLTVVFANNQKHLFDWMSRNDYNQYAQYVFISALMHAKFQETALVFAQAHQWKPYKIAQLRVSRDSTDLKHLVITMPGHIDTLWGAFFASGDPIYVNEIIAVLFEKKLPLSPATPQQTKYDLLKENKKLAEITLRQYAPYHPLVREALKAHIASGEDKAVVELLKSILHSSRQTVKEKS